MPYLSLCLVQRIVYVQYRTARKPENSIHSLFLQALDKNFGSSQSHTQTSIECSPCSLLHSLSAATPAAVFHYLSFPQMSLKMQQGCLPFKAELPVRYSRFTRHFRLHLP